MSYGRIEYKVLAWGPHPLDNYAVFVVAKEGAIGDWSAYIGTGEVPITEDEPKVAEYIASRGVKLSQKYAEFFFPSWKGLRWRE